MNKTITRKGQTFTYVTTAHGNHHYIAADGTMWVVKVKG